MLSLNAGVLRRLWPRAPQASIDAICSRSAAVFAKYGITTPLRARHFMAQISHESGGGTIKTESLYYTHAARIAEVWPSRFTAETAQPYVRDEKALADKVYNGRMGNRPGTDDGFNYRGRGPLQLTGAEDYQEIGDLIGLPLHDRPELAGEPGPGIEIAAAEFKRNGCLPFCDQDNLKAVTRRVNGGYTGLASRQSWYAKWGDVDFETTEHTEIPAYPDDHEALPTVPRGSDDVLPPGVETPGKTMAGSKTGNTAIITGAGGIIEIGKSINDSLDPIKQAKGTLQDLGVIDLLATTFAAASHNPMFWVGIAIVVGGAFIWFDRRRRLQADHV